MSTSVTVDPPFALAQALDRCAKHWWGISLTMKVSGFLIGACIGLLPAELVPFLVTACTVIAEFCLYRSDAIKGTAQLVRRKLDVYDAFGWPIPPTDLSDLQIRCPGTVKRYASKHPVTTPYFASREPVGPLRALKNVSESAWWTKHLAETMTDLCTAIVVIGIFGALVVLIIALQSTADHNTQTNVARIVTGVLMLLLSLGVVKLVIGYRGLAKNAGNSEAAAERAIQATPTELAAVSIMYDYHLARATGPLIPTWIWNHKKDELNRIWNALRNGTTNP